MGDKQLDAITGAFGFTGRALAERLLDDGHDLVTLSRRSGAGDPLGDRLRVEPFATDRPDRLAASLAGVDTLFNTFWIRFPRGTMTYERAVAQSSVLLAAAREAGVRRIVHVSVVNAAPDGPTPYVRAKAALEAIVRSSGLEWVIVRPTLTYGPGDILINNLAWALRRLPVYGLPGLGGYTVQPVHVDDVARICAEAATMEPGRTIDAAGPDILRYRDLVSMVREAIGSRSILVPMPATLVLAAARLLGSVVGDVVLTRDEVRELTSSFLTSLEPGRGTTRIAEWLPANAASLGRTWASELQRNYGLRS
jgi:NADH dehydrogenase